jgi:transposase, IS5 family
MGQCSFFDLEDNLKELSKMGDPLEKLNRLIDWQIFSRDLKKSMEKDRKSAAGRPNLDYLMMFKVLVLQTMYNLSDAQSEFQIRDRHTFKRFLGLGEEATIPDEKTIWNFRNNLSNKGIMQTLFNRFSKQLNESGYSAKKGQMVDASFVEVPRQRNTHKENEEIKQGETPVSWEENPSKLSQKDTDARWTKKNNESFYGYKDHINADVKYKLIRKYAVTSASVHDSQMFDKLIDQENSKNALWGDSAYSSGKNSKLLARKGIINNIHRKGNRSGELSEFQQGINHRKSKIRVRVEHVFASMTQMCGMYIRSIGKVRADLKIGLINLVYNMKRYVYLENFA